MSCICRWKKMGSIAAANRRPAAPAELQASEWLRTGGGRSEVPCSQRSGQGELRETENPILALLPWRPSSDTLPPKAMDSLSFSTGSIDIVVVVVLLLCVRPLSTPARQGCTCRSCSDIPIEVDCAVYRFERRGGGQRKGTDPGCSDAAAAAAMEKPWPIGCPCAAASRVRHAS